MQGTGGGLRPGRQLHVVLLSSRGARLLVPQLMGSSRAENLRKNDLQLATNTQPHKHTRGLLCLTAGCEWPAAAQSVVHSSLMSDFFSSIKRGNFRQQV